MFSTLILTKEEIIEAYTTSLFQVLENYLPLSNSNMEILPNNPFEFFILILDEMKNNPYKESLLTSLQFIYQDYLACLGIGRLNLWSSNNDLQDSYMEITFDFHYKILAFEENKNYD